MQWWQRLSNTDLALSFDSLAFLQNSRPTVNAQHCQWQSSVRTLPKAKAGHKKCITNKRFPRPRTCLHKDMWSTLNKDARHLYWEIAPLYIKRNKYNKEGGNTRCSEDLILDKTWVTAGKACTGHHTSYHVTQPVICLGAITNCVVTCISHDMKVVSCCVRCHMLYLQVLPQQLNMSPSMHAAWTPAYKHCHDYSWEDPDAPASRPFLSAQNFHFWGSYCAPWNSQSNAAA